MCGQSPQAGGFGLFLGSQPATTPATFGAQLCEPLETCAETPIKNPAYPASIKDFAAGKQQQQPIGAGKLSIFAALRPRARRCSGSTFAHRLRGPCADWQGAPFFRVATCNHPCNFRRAVLQTLEKPAWKCAGFRCVIPRRSRLPAPSECAEAVAHPLLAMPSARDAYRKP